MSHRAKEFWFVVSLLAGFCMIGAGVIWLWENHPLVILGALFAFAVLMAIVATVAEATTPPRRRANSDKVRDAATAGFIAGLLTGNFVGQEDCDDESPSP